MARKWVSVGSFRLEEEEQKAIEDVLLSGRISEWKRTREFERKWADYIGTRYAIAVNSGTSALIASLLALKHDERFPKMKDGAKVITTPVTFIATVNSIILAGYEPVFVDIDRTTFGMDPAYVGELLSSVDPDEFGAILPVHLMGYPVDVEALDTIAKKYGLVLIEDSAQAHGTYLANGRRAGSFGTISAFSFYIAHNIQVGEMGAVNTSDEKLARVVRMLKAHGRLCSCPVCVRREGRCPYADKPIEPRFTHSLVGYNFKTMDIQAALALCQLKRADTIVETRQRNVRYLNEHLSRFESLFHLPRFSEDVSYLAYPLVVRKDSSLDRETVTNLLEREGVETRPMFGCLPTQQPVFSHLADAYRGRLPNAEFIGRNAFYIGCHQYLTEEDLAHIVAAFERLFS